MSVAETVTAEVEKTTGTELDAKVIGSRRYFDPYFYNDGK